MQFDCSASGIATPDCFPAAVFYALIRRRHFSRVLLADRLQ